MRVLVGFEESGKVRDAFISKGHDAWSNDIIPARNGGKHLQKCVRKAMVEDGPWDIIILHQVCTEMAVSGNGTYGKGKPLHYKRQEAIEWAVETWELAKRHARIGCALENPVSVLWKHIGKPQYIHPYNFGHREVKKTGILTYNLPKLIHTDEVGPPPPAGSPERKEWEKVWRMAPRINRARDRSETYSGIAEAFTQWAEYTPEYVNEK